MPGWNESYVIEMQTPQQHESMMLRPEKAPKATRQDVVDYSTSLWLAAEHEQGEKIFKRNGLDNAMDGTEDRLITRTAR